MSTYRLSLSQSKMPKRLLQQDASMGGSEGGDGGDAKRRRGGQGGQESRIDGWKG